MKRFRRFATLMLAIIMAASTAVIPSYAESDIQYSESDLHELIDYDMAVDAGHVNRLNDEEDLNTLIFANEDNTKTMYFYGEDIKYTDEFGVVRDKTNKLTSTSTGYTNADNDISIHLPNTLSDGITIDYEDISLLLVPAVSELPDHIEADDVATSRGEADYVVYDDVFGAKTSLKYTPMYSGLKEDIILEEYTGVSEFQFLLYTGGLELDEVDNEYVLLDGEDAVAKLSQVFIYDSEYNTAVGSMIVTSIKDDQIYAITVCADVDFLTASSTVYPVTVDPSISINAYKNSIKYIHDATLSEQYPTTNYGSSSTLSLGGGSNSYIAMRFAELSSNSTYTALLEQQIMSATLTMKCSAKGSVNSTAYVNNYSPQSTSSIWWDESSITYNSNGVSYEPSPQVMKTISSATTTYFDITDIVKGWKNGVGNIMKGILFRLTASSSTKYYTFHSTEATSSGLSPYLTITYLAEGIYSISQGNYQLGLNDNYAGNSGVSIYGDPSITTSGLRNDNDIASLFRLSFSSDGVAIGTLADRNGYGKYIVTDGQNVTLGTLSDIEYYDIIPVSNGYLIKSKVYDDMALAMDEDSGIVTLTSCDTIESEHIWQITWSDKNSEYSYYRGLNFTAPVTSPHITSRYGVRDYGGINDHLALDMTGGSTIKSISKGTIVMADYDAGYGYFVIVKCDDSPYNSSKNLYVLYAHLASIAQSSGEIAKGATIGIMGNTGNGSETPHLHLCVFICSESELSNTFGHDNLDYTITVDPHAFFGRIFTYQQ